MALIDLASFPNSQIKPTPATKQSFQDKLDLLFVNGTVLLASENQSRTVITIKNDSSTASLKYATGTNGVTDIANSNYFLLGPNQAIDLDTPEDIYVQPSADMTVYIDEGTGA